VKAFVPVPVCVSVFVTITFTAPATPDGVVHVMLVLDTTVNDVQALPPTVAVAPARKPVPAMVIGVPPAADPDDGDIDVTVGAGFMEMLRPPLVAA
jgi:hypothetical protein